MNCAFRTASWPLRRSASAKRMNGRLSGLSSMATRHILSDLARDYESQTGTRVEIRSMGGVEAAKSVRAGEATDIVVLASKVMASLETEGYLVEGGTRDLRAVGDWRCGCAGLGLAKPRGASKRSSRPCWMRKRFATRPARAAII